MVRFEDLELFVCAADLGSLSAAARQLDVTPAVASSAIKRLEHDVGVRLLARSTRSLRLTSEGEHYIGHARSALAELRAGQDRVDRGRDEIGGLLSIAMPSDLGRSVLLPLIDEFLKAHPGLAVQVRLSDRLADLYRQPADIAIRYGTPEDSSLVALPLAADNRRILCASPGYLASRPPLASPGDLTTHNCLRFALDDRVHQRWTFTRRDESVTVPVSGDRVSDDGEAVRRWALAGHGIAYKSSLDVRRDIDDGRLLPLLTDWVGERTPLNLVSTHRLSVSRTVRALREHLQLRLTQLS